MAEPATKYLDFPDNYPHADYEIYHEVQRATIVVNQIVVDQSYFNVNETSAGNISPELIGYDDKTNAKLNEWDDIGEIDMLIADTLIRGIRIPETPKLKGYLSNFPDLIEILPSVCKLAREKLSPVNTQLSLEVIDDSATDAEFLILYVRQEHYDEKIMEIIDEIRLAYGEKLIGKQGWLLVTTDFSPPK